MAYAAGSGPSVSSVGYSQDSAGGLAKFDSSGSDCHFGPYGLIAPQQALEYLPADDQAKLDRYGTPALLGDEHASHHLHRGWLLARSADRFERFTNQASGFAGGSD